MTAESSTVELLTVFSRLARDEAKSAESLSLTANESCLSVAARAWLGSSLAGRYHLGFPGGRDIDDDDVTVSGGGLMRMGLPAVSLLEREAWATARQLFAAAHSDLRPLSGMHATICVIAMLTEPGDLIMSVDAAHGGHAVTASLVRRLGRRSCYMPWSADDPFCFDVDATAEACRRDGVAIVFIDLGTTLFPLPVRALRAALDPRTRIVYDGSHNMLLFAGGCFPNPLTEGADVLFGSAHKSFPGPQKAMVHFAASGAGQEFLRGLEGALIASQHTGDTLALYTTLLEMGMHAPAYASATVRNARRLAAALVSHGFDVVNRDGVATESGTFWLRPPPGSDNRAACRLLMRAGILTNARKLGPSEVLRIATHYVTRLGMGTEEMDAIGDAFARVLLHGVPADHVQREVRDLMAAHTDIAFSFDALLDATTRHTPDRGWTT